MGRRVRFRAGHVEVLAELNDSDTARAVLEALPICSAARTWGDEVYFDTELALGEEELVAHAPPGTVAYWLPGKAICLFFGQQPASPVTVIGRLLGNPRSLAEVAPGVEVRLEAAADPEDEP